MYTYFMKLINKAALVLAPATLLATTILTPAVSADEKKPVETYTVKEGDSLSSISQELFGDESYVDEIAYLNKIENIHKIDVDQKLNVKDVKAVKVPVDFKQKVDAQLAASLEPAPVAQVTATATAEAPATYQAPAATYQAPAQPTAPGGSVRLANGNTAGATGSAAAAEMARRTGVPASTWEHIIARESNGQVNAYNPSGASGLFQTMPGWGSTATVEDQINAATRAYQSQGLSAWGF